MMKFEMGKIRPQILLGLLVLGTIAIIALLLSAPAIEVVTGCIGGVTALSMKILDDKE